MGELIKLEDHRKPKLPIDYEECGYCGYDHDYEYESAKEWHEKNDPEGNLYK